MLAGGCADSALGGQIYAGQQSGYDVIRGVQWFNPGAFAPPQPWQWGNSMRNIVYGVYGPDFWNWDIGVQKSFAITERHRAQVCGDFLVVAPLVRHLWHAELDFFDALADAAGQPN